jgi:hypothetical protein
MRIEPTTKDNPEAIFPMTIGRLRPVASIQNTQQASPIRAIILLTDWKRRIRLEVKPIYARPSLIAE